MGVTTRDAWAKRYDRAAGELLDEPVIAAAQFLRPRGWRELARAIAGPPAGVVARTAGRAPRLRLPLSCLLAVTDDALHLLQARTQVGSPMPRAIRPLISWQRRGLAVHAEPDCAGTRLTIEPDEGPRVLLHGPPGELTDRVMRALGALPATDDALAADHAAMRRPAAVRPAFGPPQQTPARVPARPRGRESAGSRRAPAGVR